MHIILASIAIKIEIARLQTQLLALRAQITPAHAQMFDWTPIDVLTRVVPESEDAPTKGND